MANQRTTGIIVTILGAMVTCCACPLALDVIVGLTTRTGLYARIVMRGGVRILQAMQYLRSGQLICISVLALAVLVAGIVILVQARNHRAAENKP